MMTPHRSRKLGRQSSLEVPEVHWDYCFPRDAGDWICVLVGRDRETRMTVAHVVPYKGAGVEWLGEQMVRDLHRLGAHGKVVLKSDQEPAIVDVLRDVAKMRGDGRTVLEHSPVYSSKSNGFIERAVQSFEKTVRTHKLALEDKVKAKVSVKHPIFAWLVEFAADLYNKHQVGRDGKTAMQRLRGKSCIQSSVEFGSAVMFRVVGKVNGGDMHERWHSGIFLGKKAGSEENLVMKGDGGVVRARAIREVHRDISMIDLNQLRGTPHDPVGNLRGDSRDEHRPAELAGQDAEDPLGPVPKRVQITREVVQRFGATPGCLKCQGQIAGDKSFQYVHHSEACRVRMESLMRQDEKFKRLIEAAEERQTRRIAEVLERRDREAAQAAEKRQDQPSRKRRAETDAEREAPEQAPDQPQGKEFSGGGVKMK